MRHRIIIAVIAVAIVAAVVGGFLRWELPSRTALQEAATPPSGSSPTSPTSLSDLPATATTSVSLLLPELGPPAAEGAGEVASASPAIIAVNEATVVTVTIQITDARLIPASVNLQRLDAAGKITAILGTLNDAGTAGDAAAADKVFTIRRSFTEATTTPVRLRVSWALKGVLKRNTSNLLTIPVIPEGVLITDPSGISLRIPSAWAVQSYPTTASDEAAIVATSPEGSKLVVLPAGGAPYGFDPETKTTTSSILLSGKSAVRTDYHDSDGVWFLSRVVFDPLLGPSPFRIDFRPAGAEPRADEIFRGILLNVHVP
jgi:hypothetical protein